MNRTADLSLEDFRRLPGLYRRWELTEVCEPNRNYQIEDAGALIALLSDIYRLERSLAA